VTLPCTGVTKSRASLRERELLNHRQTGYLAKPKLDAVGFGSEARPRNGYVAVSLSCHTGKQQGASLLDRVGRSLE